MRRLGQRARLAIRARMTLTAATATTGPREYVKYNAGTEKQITKIAGALSVRGPFHARIATPNATPAPMNAPRAPGLVNVDTTRRIVPSGIALFQRFQPDIASTSPRIAT